MRISTLLVGAVFTFILGYKLHNPAPRSHVNVLTQGDFRPGNIRLTSHSFEIEIYGCMHYMQQPSVKIVTSSGRKIRAGWSGSSGDAQIIKSALAIPPKMKYLDVEVSAPGRKTSVWRISDFSGSPQEQIPVEQSFGTPFAVTAKAWRGEAETGGFINHMRVDVAGTFTRDLEWEIIAQNLSYSPKNAGAFSLAVSPGVNWHYQASEGSAVSNYYDEVHAAGEIIGFKKITEIVDLGELEIYQKPHGNIYGLKVKSPILYRTQTGFCGKIEDGQLRNFSVYPGYEVNFTNSWVASSLMGGFGSKPAQFIGPFVNCTLRDAKTQRGIDTLRGTWPDPKSKSEIQVCSKLVSPVVKRHHFELVITRKIGLSRQWFHVTAPLKGSYSKLKKTPANGNSFAEVSQYSFERSGR